VLKELTKELHRDEVTDEVRTLFTELDHTEKFQAAYLLRLQIVITVEYLRSDGITIAFGDIGTLLEISKRIIAKHHNVH
jgi:hypothetical protein